MELILQEQPSIYGADAPEDVTPVSADVSRMAHEAVSEEFPRVLLVVECGGNDHHKGGCA
jgi:hypothetical protein